MSTKTTVRSGQSPPSGHVAVVRRSPLKNFLRGAALIFDFGSTLGRRRISTVRTPSDADRLASDWNAVGQDMRRAMGSHPSHRSAR